MALCVLAAMAAPAVAQESAEDSAKTVAEEWLALVDSGNYAQSWSDAASYFKDQLTAEQWSAALTKVVKQIGTVESRKFLSATYMTQVPNAPKGEYVIILYEATLENGTQAVETVTPMKDTDQEWRVSGYYIAPLPK